MNAQEAKEPRRLKILRIEEGELLHFLRLWKAAAEADCIVWYRDGAQIPEDAKVVSCQYCWAARCFEFMMEHESFDPVIPGSLPVVEMWMGKQEIVRTDELPQNKKLVAELASTRKRLDALTYLVDLYG